MTPEQLFKEINNVKLTHKEVIERLKQFGDLSYNQALYDLAKDDLLPDKERNIKLYMKK